MRCVFGARTLGPVRYGRYYMLLDIDRSAWGSDGADHGWVYGHVRLPVSLHVGGVYLFPVLPMCRHL